MKHPFFKYRDARSIRSLIVCLGLAGSCTGVNATDELLPPEPELVEQVLVQNTSNDWRFDTAVVLEGTEHGLRGDGVTDNTAIFRQLLEGGNRTIHLKAGDYITGSLEIQSRTILLLAPGVTLRDSGHLGAGDRLINIRSEDVRIEGFGARVIAERSNYTTGEHRHGVFIFGAKRVVILGLKSAGHGGDGFYIGGPPGSPATDVLLKNCLSDNNRRQGLSIVSARRLRVIDCEFTNTKGTNPQAGIDFEPNTTLDEMHGIVLLRPMTKNNFGGGIIVSLGQLDANSKPVSITIMNHRSEMEKPLWTRVPKTLSSMIRYSRAQQ